MLLNDTETVCHTVYDTGRMQALCYNTVTELCTTELYSMALSNDLRYFVSASFFIGIGILFKRFGFRNVAGSSICNPAATKQRPGSDQAATKERS